MNILFVGFPVYIFVGFIVIIIGMPVFIHVTGTFLDSMKEEMLRVIAIAKG